MNEQLQSALDDLLSDGASAAKAHDATLDAVPEADKPLLARLSAIQQEDERRNRLGVRVTVNAGDFEQRRALALVELGVHGARSAGEHGRHALAFRALLARAAKLLLQMRSELDAPAHAEAVRKEAETAKFWADWNAARGR